jgi:hypothetical protein
MSRNSRHNNLAPPPGKYTPAAIFESGKEKEREFAAIISDAYAVTPSSSIQDRAGHWDVAVRFDVKSIKSPQRGGLPDDSRHFVELINVKGEPGWAYGSAHYIAFETSRFWIIVERTRLLEWTRLNMVKQSVDTPQDYKMYMRSGRRDVCVVIPSVDLCYLGTVIRKPIKFST